MQTAGRLIAKFPKGDSRYWRDKVFQRATDTSGKPCGDYHIRFSNGGVQKRWPLNTANRDDAAAKARDIWKHIKTHGEDSALTKFKPWTVKPAVEIKPITVGEFIEAVRAVAPVRPPTFLTYERKFRFLVSQLEHVDESRAKYDYVNGGSLQWREKVNTVPLATVTPAKVLKWRVRYIGQAGKNPLQQNSAKQTAASILRNSKALFNAKLLRNLSLALPSPLPFEGVDIGKRPRTRYRSRINAPLMVKLAQDELKPAHPELYKIFLLSIGAGLRRCEIDKLLWKQFEWHNGTLSIEASEYGNVKTEASAEQIDLSEDMIAYFKDQFAQSESEFVISPATEPGQPKHWHHYQCDRHFNDFIDWLREKGVEARNPIHTLRKEFGSLINQQFGLYAASAALRHSNISITREAYVDRKERIALDLSALTAT